MITPVEVLSVKPDGKVGLTEYVTDPEKLEAVSEDVAVIAVPTVAETDWVEGDNDAVALVPVPEEEIVPLVVPAAIPEISCCKKSLLLASR